MYKKIVVFSFFSCLFLALGSTASAQTTEQIQDYKVDLQINSDSSVNITETIVYNFGSVNHHGIFRDVPYSYKARGGNFNLRLSDIAVVNETGQQQRFSTSNKGSELEIKIGDPDVLISGIHTYVVSYKVARALNYFSDHDELYWNAIGTNWTVPILQSEATIHLPEGAKFEPKPLCFTGSLNSNAQNCTIIGSNTDPTLAQVTTKDKFLPGQGLTLVIGFPKGLVTPPTFWQNSLDTAKDNGILVLPVLVFIAMFLIWRKWGRDAKGKGIIVPQYEAPEGLTPIEMGTIVDKKVDKKDIAAEIIYLATQGFLKITRVEKKILGVFDSHDYELESLKGYPEALKRFDEVLVDNLFLSDPMRNKVLLSKLRSNQTFSRALTDAIKNIYKDLTRAGYFKSNPRIMKAAFVGVPIMITIWLSVFASDVFGSLGVWSFIASGAIVIIIGLLMPARTQKGADMKEYILGLKLYLDVAEKDRLEFHNAPEKNPQQFEKLLPYAIALGVEKQWAKQFEGIYNTQPSWYADSTGQSFVGGFNTALFVSSLGDFSTSVNSAVATATAASGGSGFGGGGGVGGGGGGGGGGGW